MGYGDAVVLAEHWSRLEQERRSPGKVARDAVADNDLGLLVGEVERVNEVMGHGFRRGSAVYDNHGRQPDGADCLGYSQLAVALHELHLGGSSRRDSLPSILPAGRQLGRAVLVMVDVLGHVLEHVEAVKLDVRPSKGLGHGHHLGGKYRVKHAEVHQAVHLGLDAVVDRGLDGLCHVVITTHEKLLIRVNRFPSCHTLRRLPAQAAWKGQVHCDTGSSPVRGRLLRSPAAVIVIIH